VTGPHVGEDFVYGTSPIDGDEGLGLVDFAMFPHLDHEEMPENSMARARKWAASVPVQGYALDDQTAIKVIGSTVQIVSEGHWKLFTK
jgi:dipeptidase E